MRPITWSASLALALAATAAQAQQPAPALDRAVRAATARQLGVAAERVRLDWGTLRTTVPPDSSTPFRIAGDAGSGWVIVTFESHGTAPAAARVRVTLHDSVWTAAHPMPVGATIGPDDLRAVLVAHTPASPNPITSSPIGWRTLRALPEGTPLVPPAIGPAPLLADGDEVRLSIEQGAVRVSLGGQVVKGGAAGDTVFVRLTGRRGLTRAVITGPGTARPVAPRV